MFRLDLYVRGAYYRDPDDPDYMIGDTDMYETSTAFVQLLLAQSYPCTRCGGCTAIGEGWRN